MKGRRVSFFLLIVIAVQSFGQDDHYWSQQYGAVSTLMGGAVIAGVRDNTAIFYNPGALSFINIPSLSVDANVYKVDKIFLNDGIGDGINLNSAQMSIYPQIISGLVNLFKSERFRFSYALLTRQYSNLLMDTRYTSADIQNTDIPPTEKYIGAFDYANQLNEQWGGLGVGYRINDHLGVGATVFVTYRGQSYQVTNYFRVVDKVDSVYEFGSVNNDKGVKYKTFGLLAKFGLNYEIGRFKLGFTLTTPSIQFYGSGTAQREVSLIVLARDSASTGGFVVMDRMEGIRARYKYPLSLGFGFEYKTAKTRIAFSAEYFFGIKLYHLLQPTSDPFVYPPSYKDTAALKPIFEDFLHVENKSKPVFNFGIGFSQELSPKFTLMLGARTDYSAFAKSDESDSFLHGAGQWDLYHLSAGLSYHQKRNTITAGFTYSVSPKTHIDQFDVLNPYYQADVTPFVFSQSFGVVIGYTYYFPK